MKLTLCTQHRKIITVPLNIMSSALCSSKKLTFMLMLSAWYVFRIWLRFICVSFKIILGSCVFTLSLRCYWAHGEFKWFQLSASWTQNSWTHTSTNLLGNNVFSCKKVILKTTSGHFYQDIGVTIRGFQRKKTQQSPLVNDRQFHPRRDSTRELCHWEFWKMHPHMRTLAPEASTSGMDE